MAHQHPITTNLPNFLISHGLPLQIVTTRPAYIISLTNFTPLHSPPLKNPYQFHARSTSRPPIHTRSQFTPTTVNYPKQSSTNYQHPTPKSKFVNIPAYPPHYYYTSIPFQCIHVGKSPSGCRVSYGLNSSNLGEVAR